MAKEKKVIEYVRVNHGKLIFFITEQAATKPENKGYWQLKNITPVEYDAPDGVYTLTKAILIFTRKILKPKK